MTDTSACTTDPSESHEQAAGATDADRSRPEGRVGRLHEAMLLEAATTRIRLRPARAETVDRLPAMTPIGEANDDAGTGTRRRAA